MRWPGAARRATVRALAEGLLAGSEPPAGVSEAEWERARRLARECAGWFVRPEFRSGAALS